MAAHRCREQRAEPIGKREQDRLGVGNDGAATAEDEWTLGAQQRFGELLDRGRIGMQASGSAAVQSAVREQAATRKADFDGADLSVAGVGSHGHSVEHFSPVAAAAGADLASSALAELL